MTIDFSTTPVTILAGGQGARFNSESEFLPKPMIVVAGKPILQHIIDGFIAQGFREFIILTGHLHEKFVEYFVWRHGPSGGTSIYTDHVSGATINIRYTGEESHTGERVYQARDLLDRRFVLTYGDGLSNVSMVDVMAEHTNDLNPASRQPLVTLTAVNPPGRFGVLEFNGGYRNHVRRFSEKSSDEWINGGFMIVEPEFIPKYLEDDMGTYQLEREALPALADHWMLRAYRHSGFWACMDTRRDLEKIESDVLGHGGSLPWLNLSLEMR